MSNENELKIYSKLEEYIFSNKEISNENITEIISLK